MLRVLAVAVGMLGATARAEAPLRADVGVWTGLVHSNAPVTPALGLTTALRWKGAVSLRLRGGFMPHLRTNTIADARPRQLHSTEQSMADISLLFEPILMDVVGWNGRIHLGVGMGVVHTRDDLETTQRQDDPSAIVVQSQWHPTASWTVGLSGPLSRHVAVSFDVASLNYVETVQVWPEVRRPLITSVSLLIRPSRERRPLHD